MNKEDNSYKTISEVVKILNLKSKKGDSDKIFAGFEK